jgi:hypothetical protein
MVNQLEQRQIQWLWGCIKNTPLFLLLKYF